MNTHNGSVHESRMTVAMAREVLSPHVRAVLGRLSAPGRVYWDVRVLLDAGVPPALALALRCPDTRIGVRARTDLDRPRRVTVTTKIVWAPDIASHLRGWS